MPAKWVSAKPPVRTCGQARAGAVTPGRSPASGLLQDVRALAGPRHASAYRRAATLALPAGIATLLIAMFAMVYPAHAQSDAVARGQYLLHAAGCAICHTRPEDKDKNTPAGEALAGGRALDTPFGRFYSPNITPHPELGIGRWSADDLWRALSAGVGPGGIHCYPVFPYTSYTRMRREDADAIHAYLMSVPPRAVRNHAHEIAWYVRWRFANRVWKWLFLDAERFAPVAGKDARWNRGAYLVDALGHCGECHSPRNRAGAVRREQHLAGNPEGPEGEPVPSIRSDGEDGIGEWSFNEIVTYLKSGEDPDFDFAGGAMVEVIEDNTSRLSDEDRNAIATYLKDLPAL